MTKKSLHLPLAIVILAGSASAVHAQAAPAAKPAASPAAVPAAPAAAPAAPSAAAAPSAGPSDYNEVPGIDMVKLNETQKKLALKIMNEERCKCGCGFTIAACRHKDQKCPVSPVVGNQLVADILAGKPEKDLRESVKPTPAPPPPPPLETKVNTFDLTGAPVKGPKDAKVTITEWSDFQCPFCSQAIAWVNDILAAYPKDVKVVFKQYPLPFHNQAHLAAQASLAAHKQGKFWELHDKMFANFRTLSPENIKTWAKEVGVDTAVFNKELDEGTYKAKVDKEMQEAQAAGVQGTPSFFVNGKRYNGQRDMVTMKKIIDDELKGGGVKPAEAVKTDAKAPAATGK